MEKHELLRELERALSRGEVSRADIEPLIDEPTAAARRTHLPRISEVLSYIGGIIVFLGIAVLVAENWGQLTATTRILATFGSAVAAYIVGYLLSEGGARIGRVGIAFHIIAALLFPLGLFVVFEEAGYRIAENSVQSVMALALFVLYLSSFFVFRRNLFLLFAFVFGTWLFFAFTNWLVSGRAIASSDDFFQYRTLFVGLSFLSFGYWFAERKEKPLTGSLYAVGIVLALGAAFALGGFGADKSIFWELLFPVLVFGAIVGSVYLRSRSILAFAALFLIAFIIKVTGEYFAESLSWPLALVLAGFAVIAIGYGVFYVYDRHFTSGTKSLFSNSS